MAILAVAACAIMPSAATRLSRGAAAAASKAKSASSPEAAACNEQRTAQHRATVVTEPRAHGRRVTARVAAPTI